MQRNWQGRAPNNYEMDHLSPTSRSANMRAIRSKNTSPELVVRRLLFGLGYRYRVHDKSLPGAPDVVFSARRKAIFIHGCFWHQHTAQECRRGRPPKSNLSYWTKKLRGNVDRDKQNRRELSRYGWKTLVIWECQVSNPRKVEQKLKRFLGPTRHRFVESSRRRAGPHNSNRTINPPTKAWRSAEPRAE